MAIDGEAHQVLVVFRSPPGLMALSSQDGRIVAKVETRGDADDVFVDRKRRRIYVSCGEGVVDVLESGEARYRRLARLPTVPGARTSLFVPELDRLFVAVRAASNNPAAIWVFRPASWRRSELRRRSLSRRFLRPGRVPAGGSGARATRSRSQDQLRFRFALGGSTRR